MKNEILRHTLAAIKYRFDKSVRIYTKDFADFSLGKGSRSPKEIINHMYRVLHATRLFMEKNEWLKRDPEQLSLGAEVERFRDELVKLDATFSNLELPIETAKKLLQGPLADVLTHIGQVSMLQRLSGDPVEGENYFAADIKTGLV